MPSISNGSLVVDVKLREMIHRNKRESYISSAVAFNRRFNDYVKVFLDKLE